MLTYPLDGVSPLDAAELSDAGEGSPGPTETAATRNFDTLAGGSTAMGFVKCRPCIMTADRKGSRHHLRKIQRLS